MKTNILLVGSGWRAEYFLAVARLLPEEFDITAVVTANAERAKRYESWGFTCRPSLDDALALGRPDYAVVCVAITASSAMVLRLFAQGIPVLDETPCAHTLSALHEMARAVREGARFQMAEQYHLRPDHAARACIVRSGRIGRPVQALVSLTNTYHAVSLLRFYLGTAGHTAQVRACRLAVPGMPGHGRGGPPQKEEPAVYPQTVAVFGFDGQTGLYDFEEAQHRSYIRTQRVMIKGERGVIDNDEVRWLQSYDTPMDSRLRRHNKGEFENMEGAGLKGFTACGEWVYETPFPNARLTDDEIAVALCMRRMAAYCRGGPGFYSFAQAAQDTYLAQLLARAEESGSMVTAQPQPWTDDLLAEYL